MEALRTFMHEIVTTVAWHQVLTREQYELRLAAENDKARAQSGVSNTWTH